MEYLEDLFPSGRSMKAIVYGKYSEARGIYIGVIQGDFSGPSLFPLYIKNLPKSILKCVMNMYLYDTMGASSNIWMTSTWQM